MIRFLIIVVTYCYISIGCQKKAIKIPNFDPNGKMLFVEDVDGKGGLLSFDFGDIVVLDPESGEKIRLTNDRYYDIHPYWSPDGKKVIFESKRIDTGGEGIYDLSDDSHLFILDILRGKIEQFDKDFEKIFWGEIGDDNRSPAWSPVSNKIAFVTRIGYREKVVLFEIDNKMVTSLTKPGEFKQIDRLRWSPKGRYLAFEFGVKSSFINRGVAVIDIEDGKIEIVTDPTDNYQLGGWSRDGSKILFRRYSNKPSEAGFYTYSLKSRKIKLIKLFSKIFGRNAQFGSSDNIIAFIGGHAYSDSSDIWMYDMIEDQFIRITSDGHSKDGLIWFSNR